jgi:hypothetical protein
LYDNLKIFIEIFGVFFILFIIDFSKEINIYKKLGINLYCLYKDCENISRNRTQTFEEDKNEIKYHIQKILKLNIIKYKDERLLLTLFVHSDNCNRQDF